MVDVASLQDSGLPTNVIRVRSPLHLRQPVLRPLHRHRQPESADGAAQHRRRQGEPDDEAAAPRVGERGAVSQENGSSNGSRLFLPILVLVIQLVDHIVPNQEIKLKIPAENVKKK